MLTTVPRNSKWFSVLNLKDAFFCLPIDEQAELLFALEWQDPETKVVTRISEFPAIFGEILAKDLMGIQLNLGVLL